MFQANRVAVREMNESEMQWVYDDALNKKGASA
jgi:hypothetical protein